MADITFYTLGDRRYFVGVVGLINSLRLVGHHEEIVVLDCGFDSGQRSLLSRECTVLDLPPTLPKTPFRMEFKLIAPRVHSSDIVVLIDSDIIVTERLDDLVASARHGHVAGYPDPEWRRWFPEWQQIFEFSHGPRHDVYICAGLIALSKLQHPKFLDRWFEACKRTSIHVSSGSADGPVSQADQDALNAMLMCEYPKGTSDPRPSDEFAQARELKVGIEILDSATLRCEFEGKPLLALHAAGRMKPWFRRSVRRNAYTALLTRLLLSHDVAIQVAGSQIPIWLRHGILPKACLITLDLQNGSFRWIRKHVMGIRKRVKVLSARAHARLSASP